jgi:hypothetical protein
MSDLEGYYLQSPVLLCRRVELWRSIGKCPDMLTLSSITNHGLWEETSPERKTDALRADVNQTTC